MGYKVLGTGSLIEGKQFCDADSASEAQQILMVTRRQLGSADVVAPDGTRLDDHELAALAEREKKGRHA